MLERFFKSQVASVSDSTYCHRITDALTAAGIKFYCKTKDVNQRSVFDATRMRAQIGTFGIKPQYITEIFVDKENAELALPVAGLMSTESAESVAAKMQALNDALKAHGVAEDIGIFMTLAFVSLPVIPKLRLNTYGIIDVAQQKVVPAVF